MTVYGANGQVVHHNNCTYCVYRWYIPTNKKKKGSRGAEICRLTNNPIPPPMKAGRWCGAYRQLDCECTICRGEDGSVPHQLDNTLDKQETT